MQRYKLEKAFRKAGWWFLRHGNNHDVWTNGKEIEMIPRHPQVRDSLAKGLIKKHGL